MKYPVVLNQTNNEEVYEVTVPDLPGCYEKSTSIDLAIEKITESISSHLSILAEYGEKIPHATSIQHHQKKFTEGIWAIVNIDITPYLGKSHKINVTLPELLIKQIDDKVSKSEDYKTRSGFIAVACLTELAK